MKPDIEKETKYYIDAGFEGGWYQEEGKDPGSVLYRTSYVINCDNCTIIWTIQFKTKISLSNTEAEYIALSQAMRYALPFVSLMKDIKLVLKLQGYTPTVLCSILEKPVTVYEDNQGAIEITVFLQIRPRTKHITIKDHPFQSFVANGDVEIKHVDAKEQIVDILQSHYILSCSDIYATRLTVGR